MNNNRIDFFFKLILIVNKTETSKFLVTLKMQHMFHLVKPNRNIYFQFLCVTFNFKQFQNSSMINMEPITFSEHEPPPPMIYISFNVSTVPIYDI